MKLHYQNWTVHRKNVFTSFLLMRKLKSLHGNLEVWPRKRKKADAYLGLKKKLRDEYGVELNITSRGTKKEEPGNGQEQ